MLNSIRTSQSFSKVPPQFRPLKVMEGDHKLTRQYHIFHYTNKIAADNIMKTGELKPGMGHHGMGIYFTLMHPNNGFSSEEIKLAVRNSKLPDSAISDYIMLDTENFKGIEIQQKVNTVFIPIDTPLSIKGISVHGETPNLSSSNQ